MLQHQRPPNQTTFRKSAKTRWRFWKGRYALCGWSCRNRQNLSQYCSCCKSIKRKACQETYSFPSCSWSWWEAWIPAGRYERQDWSLSPTALWCFGGYDSSREITRHDGKTRHSDSSACLYARPHAEWCRCYSRWGSEHDSCSNPYVPYPYGMEYQDDYYRRHDAGGPSSRTPERTTWGHPYIKRCGGNLLCGT